MSDCVLRTSNPLPQPLSHFAQSWILSSAKLNWQRKSESKKCWRTHDGIQAREGYKHTLCYDPRLVKNRFGRVSVTACAVWVEDRACMGCKWKNSAAVRTMLHFNWRVMHSGQRSSWVNTAPDGCQACPWILRWVSQVELLASFRFSYGNWRPLFKWSF